MVILESHVARLRIATKVAEIGKRLDIRFLTRLASLSFRKIPRAIRYKQQLYRSMMVRNAVSSQLKHAEQSLASSEGTPTCNCRR